jgi:hypothetical protein
MPLPDINDLPIVRTKPYVEALGSNHRLVSATSDTSTRGS